MKQCLRLLWSTILCNYPDNNSDLLMVFIGPVLECLIPWLIYHTYVLNFAKKAFGKTKVEGCPISIFTTYSYGWLPQGLLINLANNWISVNLHYMSVVLTNIHICGQLASFSVVQCHVTLGAVTAMNERSKGYAA